ncbi:two-component sensor histidine kinase [Gracilibacillus halophilus YIM-C55.5]|uniref:Signal transduction histidine-protein kinase/phosphatase DegS n=1 Tax=Gracilibacillus halophilus YIM-C55.5 TaxID=1308866 RepID=N4WDN4_9BACI|nr:two-component sensor histidine kinase [Gracilibacillus halophilus YIM-C55.5]
MVQKDRDLDYIIDEMIDTVKNSKDEIFHIGEESRQEYDQLREELEELKEEVTQVIDEGDYLEQQSRYSRKRLAEVSRNFQTYSEEEIRQIYDKAHQIQSELTMKREKEARLRERRDDIERRLKSIEQMIERAEGLVGKISIVLNYLNEDFRQVSDLLQDAQEKQAFGLKIIEAQEEERRRLSREIHDGPAQMLANILLRSEVVDRAYKKGNMESAVDEMKSVRPLIRNSLQEVRRIIYDLRPMALDDLGLIPTIKKYITTIQDYHDIHIEFFHKGFDDRLTSQYEVALFRLIQESIQNSIKHAEAAQIDVKIEINDKYVIAVVKDDGKGFDVSEKKTSFSVF